MDRTKMDKKFLDSLDLKSSMDHIMELTESVKYDLVKAEKDHQKSGKFTMSCLYRVRQLLVDLEKLGLSFVSYRLLMKKS